MSRIKQFGILLVMAAMTAATMIFFFIGKGEKMSHNSQLLIDHPQIQQVLFHPRRESAFEAGGNGVEVHLMVAENVSLAGRIFVAAADSPIILFWHGNGEIAADYEQIAQIYTNMNITFLVMDFRGYGLSDGVPTGSALLADGIAVFERIQDVLQQHNITTEQIFVMGRSMGSAAAIAIAAHAGDAIAGLIIESGFAYSIPLMERLGGLSLDADESQGFGNHAKISQVTVPTLIIHGEEDQIIPVADGRALFDAAASNKKHILTIPHAGHNDLMMVGQREYFQAIYSFVGDAG
ncbi:MAG: alpha/beta fold hydrolase [Magnetococcales bacterium]|nr:alpha/beta fold hydrolase [Magnetococcales bacterium]